MILNARFGAFVITAKTLANRHLASFDSDRHSPGIRGGGSHSQTVSKHVPITMHAAFPVPIFHLVFDNAGEAIAFLQLKLSESGFGTDAFYGGRIRVLTRKNPAAKQRVFQGQIAIRRRFHTSPKMRHPLSAVNQGKKTGLFENERLRRGLGLRLIDGFAPDREAIGEPGGFNVIEIQVG
jgi:hypothetical protein